MRHCVLRTALAPRLTTTTTTATPATLIRHVSFIPTLPRLQLRLTAPRASLLTPSSQPSPVSVPNLHSSKDPRSLSTGAAPAPLPVQDTSTALPFDPKRAAIMARKAFKKENREELQNANREVTKKWLEVKKEAKEESRNAAMKAAKKAAKKAAREAKAKADVPVTTSATVESIPVSDTTVITVKARKMKITMTSPTPPPKPVRPPKRIRSVIETKHRPAHSRIAPAARSPTPTHVHEEISDSVQILCEAMQEAKVKRVRDRPPVFLASTTEQAELAMQLFTEYYAAIKGGPGPVGFDTESTTGFVPRKGEGLSLVQIATQDVCLIFQVYRMTKDNTAPQLFPPRLKAFLEDPGQLMAGVGAFGDAKLLRQSYGIECAGIVLLEAMAKERNFLAGSLADLDAMFGRPGREVIKSKAILGWNWDREVLDPKWVWYAAKDAFAGVAIYENMLEEKLKEGYVPYDQQYPMTEAEEMKDIFLHLQRSLNGNGKRASVYMMESTIIKSYPRFRKVYQPDERVTKAQKYVRMLLQEGLLRYCDGKDPSSELERTDSLAIAGRSLQAMLRTQEAVDVLGPYFNNQTLDISTLAPKGISVPEPAASSVEQDLVDLRLFLDLSWLWDRPRKISSLSYIYLNELTVAETRKLRVASSVPHDTGMMGPEPKPPNAEIDRPKCNLFWTTYLDRLKRRNVLQQANGQVELAPEIEAALLKAVPPPPPSPVLVPRSVHAEPSDKKEKKRAKRAKLSQASKTEAKTLLGDGTVPETDIDDIILGESQERPTQEQGQDADATKEKTP